MRSFISVDFPEDILKEIIKIQELLPEFEGKKTEAKNLHLTLKFLGEIDGKKVEEVKRRLNAIKFFQFKANLREMGVFSEKFIRIVWLGVFGCENLQKEIDSSLDGLFEKEKRFMGHLTLARVKSVKNKKKFVDELKNISIPELSFEVNNFKLKKSVLKENGPIYSNIEVYSLKN
jgi:2'-5' RNA ligase